MVEDLKRILTIVEEGSMTRAAERLHVTQPALSHVIKRVEQQVGIKLFRLSGKKLLLTRKGSESLVVMERIVRLWEEMAERKSAGYKESCTVGIYDNAAIILSSLFKKYYDEGKMGLDIIIDNSEKLFSQLAYGIADICICIYDPQKLLPPNISLITSYAEKLLPVSSRQWSEDLSHIPFIFYNRDSVTRKYIDKAFIKRDIQPTVIVESTSPLFIKELAFVGCGVALLPQSFVRNELKDGTLQIIDMPIRFERIISIYRNNANMSAGKNKFIREITSHLSNTFEIVKLQ